MHLCAVLRVVSATYSDGNDFHLALKEPVMRTRTTLAATAAGVLLLAACGTDDTASTDTASSDTSAGSSEGDLQVVASTDVWASVAQAVAGDVVEVTDIITDPAADPHSYESTPADAATVTDADLVVYNGSGYDVFMDDILSTEGADANALSAFELSGYESGVNEHVWYDLPTVGTVAEEIAAQLSELDPDNAETYTANAEAFGAQVDELLTRAEAVDGAGTDAVATEPIADYLVEAAGLSLVSPDVFVEAIEEESDPSAASVAEMNDLLTGGTVDLLVFNSQTATPVTEDVRATAEAASIPVVEMAETLPADTDYVEWMGDQISDLEDALSA